LPTPSTLERCGYPPLTLPASAVAQGVHGGRAPYEGYQRGVGLEYGDLRQAVESHPLYQEALRAATNRTVMSVDRLKNLFLIVAVFFDALESRNIIEFGCYRGGSVLFFATLLKRLYPKAKVYGLDTFKGMPASTRELDLHGEGEFADTSIEDIRKAARKLRLDNVILVQGLVQDTFPSGAPRDARFGLAHIDLDLYAPIKYVQDAVWDRMAPGGYVVYDDATASTCIGATQAVEELIADRRVHSEQVFPHFVFRAGLDAGQGLNTLHG
jgi:predicted O-methyltransferase YrrM